MMASSKDQHDNLIGQRIKERRTGAGMSLRQLARKTDLTASFISQLERGLTNPSISTLRRIADSLGVSILSFFVDLPNGIPIIHKDTRPKVTFPDSGLSYELLTPMSARRIEAFIGRIAPGVGNFVRPLREPTEECVYVLSGSVKIELEIGEYVLHAGDSICFEGALLKGMSNDSEEEAVWISMLTPSVF
jgi:transcriptional regulator with XRE-family HTH domain